MWAVSNDELIEYRPLTEDKLNETLELLHSNFFLSESMSKSVGLPKDPEAIMELNELILKAAEDGVSLIAIEKAAGRVVGCLINKIHVKENASSNFFEDVNCKHPSSNAYLQLNAEIDKAADYFNTLGTDCYLELMFVSVSLQFRNKGIAREITMLAMDLPRQLRNGENVKIGLNGQALPVTSIPSTVIAVCTSTASKSIPSRLGFKEILEIDFRERQSLLLGIPAFDIPLVSVMEYNIRY